MEIGCGARDRGDGVELSRGLDEVLGSDGWNGDMGGGEMGRCRQHDDMNDFGWRVGVGVYSAACTFRADVLGPDVRTHRRPISTLCPRHLFSLQLSACLRSPHAETHCLSWAASILSTPTRILQTARFVHRPRLPPLAIL